MSLGYINTPKADAVLDFYATCREVGSHPEVTDEDIARLKYRFTAARQQDVSLAILRDIMAKLLPGEIRTRLFRK